MICNVKPANATGRTVEFQRPYGACELAWHVCEDAAAAQRMAAFYRSCGSPARVI